MQDMSCAQEIDRIIASDGPDLEKLAQAFDCITTFMINNAAREVELSRVMQDREAVVKTQIKMETIKHARSIFEQCYRRITGRRPWLFDGNPQVEA
ncbi:MAG: hypothetical protein M1546_15650 [Chloroflexi bacterium]|nr:hypothetical protein [Chloroflexota bacterium]